MSLPEEVVQIPITKLRAFPEHPFYVRDDDMMQQLVESVRQVGVLMPIIVRGSEDGFYEISILVKYSIHFVSQSHCDSVSISWRHFFFRSCHLFFPL